VKKITHMTLFQRWHLSLFEKVILVNSLMLIGEALVGLWITSHNLESHHYLIDTSFIILATLLTLLTNIFLLRISFRPLFGLLSTIRAISAGNTHARAPLSSSDTEINELAQSFNTMLNRLEEVRREQTALILQAQEDERRRIALELHDETGQNLTALLVHTELLHQRFQVLPQTTRAEDTHKYIEEGLLQLTKLTQNTLENIRILAQQLRPSVLDDLGLLAAFRWLVADCAERLHIMVDLHVEGIKDGVHTLPPDYETALFRIAQESLTNIARHAQTHNAILTLRQDTSQVYLQIQDRGCGCNPEQLRKGMGIFGMRERATLPGGTLTINTHPGQGTTVRAVLPFQHKQKSTAKELPTTQATVEEIHVDY
jgi:two-component system sensor histidine kinase UhpB